MTFHFMHFYEHYSNRYPIPLLTSPLEGGGRLRLSTPSARGAGRGRPALSPAKRGTEGVDVGLDASCV